MDANLIVTFFLLVGLELVLGIDNILLISIVTDRLEPSRQRTARILGLGLALLIRLLLLFGVSYLLKLSEPILLNFSWKDLILLAGGGFLLFKAVREIHHVVEGDDSHEAGGKKFANFSAAVGQIVVLDIVFSIDSVITAVGLTDHLLVIYAAVIVSFVVVLIFANAVARFVQGNPALKILALSFLVTIGVTLVMEGLHGHVPKAYIYLPMGFALAVELLQMRYTRNVNKGKIGQGLK